MKTFSEIVLEIGKTDKNTSHTYGQWYDLWFKNLKDKSINVLEVGVCVFGGGCVLSFAEYFKNATIWAVDITKKQCSEEVFNHPRIKFFEEDAYKPELIRHFVNVKFDIIIDDASHEVNDQFKLLSGLHQFLQPNGFYIIEDCCTSHWLPHLQECRKMGLQQTIIDMSTDKCYDNTLIRFDKK